MEQLPVPRNGELAALCAKRPRRQGVVYGGRRRAEKRKRTTRHVNKIDASTGCGKSVADSIQLSAVTVGRIVDGQYEWRDGGFVKRRRTERGGDGIEWQPGVT